MESPNVTEEKDSDPSFTGSLQFAQLLTLPIKCHTSSNQFSSENKENDVGTIDVSTNNKNKLTRGDSFKRPNSPPYITLQNKRVKCNLFGLSKSEQCHETSSSNSDENNSSEDGVRNSQNSFLGDLEPIGKDKRRLFRSQSESAVMTAMERSDSDPLLIGDTSRRLLLPLVSNGKHRDLKEVEPSTLVDLMNGEYSSQLKCFTIIDCRFPYEYQGGHIKGAVNLYTQQQIKENLMKYKPRLLETTKTVDSQEMTREVIVFHCEFSSKRAPDLCRYLRQLDRMTNDYPWLHYPELYVLFGGYKNFFEKHPTFCEPQQYRTMLDEAFTDEYKLCKRLCMKESETKKKKSSKIFPRSSSSFRK